MCTSSTHTDHPNPKLQCWRLPLQPTTLSPPLRRSNIGRKKSPLAPTPPLSGSHTDGRRQGSSKEFSPPQALPTAAPDLWGRKWRLHGSEAFLPFFILLFVQKLRKTPSPPSKLQITQTTPKNTPDNLANYLC